jgi:hypothetical protein
MTQFSYPLNFALLNFNIESDLQLQLKFLLIQNISIR